MYAITTQENKKTLYVSDCSKRSFDQKYIVEYSLDQLEARRFEKKEVEEIIPNILNPFDRQFEKVPVMGKAKKRIAATEDLS